MECNWPLTCQRVMLISCAANGRRRRRRLDQAQTSAQRLQRVQFVEVPLGELPIREQVSLEDLFWVGIGFGRMVIG